MFKVFLSRCATTTTGCLTRHLQTCLRTCVKAFMLMKIKWSQIWWNLFLVMCSNLFFFFPTWCNKAGKKQKSHCISEHCQDKVPIPLKDVMGIAHCPRILGIILEWGHLLMFVSGSVWDPQALSRSQWHASHQALRVECVWSGPPCRCSCIWKRVGVSLRGISAAHYLLHGSWVNPPPPFLRSCISSFAIWHVNTKFTESLRWPFTLHCIWFVFF